MKWAFQLAQRTWSRQYKDWSMCKGSQSNDLVLSRPTKLLNYHRTWNESKETNFRQIIKPLSFMTQSQWKLPSLRLCPAAEKKKKSSDMWGNKGTITELQPLCASSGTRVDVRHWGLPRHGLSAIPEPDWVQITRILFRHSNAGKRMSKNGQQSIWRQYL